MNIPDTIDFKNIPYMMDGVVTKKIFSIWLRQTTWLDGDAIMEREKQTDR